MWSLYVSCEAIYQQHDLCGDDSRPLLASYVVTANWANSLFNKSTTINNMCYKTTCATCNKATWSGCGQHIEVEHKKLKTNLNLECFSGSTS